MKMKGLKKLLVSLGLCAVLTVGMSTAAFADSTEAILAPAPEENSIPEVPILSTEEVDNATYVGSTSNIAQTAATETSISLAWNKVEGATKYTIRIKSSNGADSYKVLGTTSKTKCKINKLKPGKAYTVAILQAMTLKNPPLSPRSSVLHYTNPLVLKPPILQTRDTPST